MPRYQFYANPALQGLQQPYDYSFDPELQNQGFQWSDIPGALNALRRGANQSAAKMLDLGLAATPIGMASAGEQIGQKIAGALGFDKPPQPEIAGYKLPGMQDIYNTVREKMGLPSAINEPKTAFEEKYPLAGDIAHETGNFLPETLVSMGAAPLVKGAQMTSKLLPRTQRAISTAIGAMGGGALSQKDPVEIAQNTAILPAGEALGEVVLGAAAKGLKKGYQGVKNLVTKSSPVDEATAALEAELPKTLTPQSPEEVIDQLPKTITKTPEPAPVKKEPNFRDTINKIPEDASELTNIEKNRYALQETIKSFEKEGIDPYKGDKKVREAFQQRYRENREAFGLNPNYKDAPGGFSKKFLNFVNVMDDIETATGIETGGFGRRFVDADMEATHHVNRLRDVLGVTHKNRKFFKRRGFKDSEISDIMEYVFADETGQIKFDPRARTEVYGKKTFEIPEFNFSQLSPQARKALKDPKVISQLVAERQGFDEARKIAMSELGKEVGEIRGYVPLMEKYNFSGAPGEKSILSPSVLRTRANRDAPLFERDYWKLKDSYARKVARGIAYKDVLQERLNLTSNLQLLGLDDVAKRIDKQVAYTLGFKEPKELRKYTAQELAEKTSEELDQLARKLGIAPDIRDSLAQWTRDMMYRSWIGQNINNLFAQMLQPMLTGSPEIGMGRILMQYAKSPLRAAQKVTRTTSKEALKEKLALEAVSTRLRQAKFNPVELTDSGPMDMSKFSIGGKDLGFLNPVKKGTNEVLKSTSHPGMAAQDIIDNYGRKQVFLAGRKQFLREKNPLKLTRDMMDFESQAVRDAYKSGGKEAAAREYGLLRSQRIMHRFSRADRPEVMQNALGELMPFTSFGRGEYAKLRYHLKNFKDPVHKKMLLKRVLYPMLIAAAVSKPISTVTGKDESDTFTYLQPILATPSTIQGTVNPAVGSVTEGMRREGLPGAIKGGLSVLPLPNMIQKLTKDSGPKAKKKRKKKRVTPVSPSNYTLPKAISGGPAWKQ